MITGTLRRLATSLSGTAAFGVVVRKLERRARHQRLLRVLAYHRIDEVRNDDPYYPGLISATPKQFAQQMDLIAGAYSACSMDDVVEAASGGRQLPDNAVLLTFDDATEDFEANAWPVLKKRRLPATVFVPTAYPDDNDRHFWWDRLYRALMCSPNGTQIPVPHTDAVSIRTPAQRTALFRRLRGLLKQLPHEEFLAYMDALNAAAGVPDPPRNNVAGWDALRRMQQEGATLAAHTHTHPMLNQLAVPAIREEVRTSLAVLTRELGRCSRTLAYPAGGVSETVVSVMRDERVDLAFSTQRGVNPQRFADPHRLRRINVGARTTLSLLRLQLANWGRTNGSAQFNA